jgi:hypothetical protein
MRHKTGAPVSGTLVSKTMADTRSTKISFIRAVHLCFLAAFAPKKLAEAEELDNSARAHFSGNAPHEPRAYIVRRAVWASFSLVFFSGIIGFLIGTLLRHQFGSPRSIVISMLQIIGASFLLWGTLFIRGWEIQSGCGVTLSERVNQWIYRFLYCVGTGIAVWSLAWM